MSFIFKGRLRLVGGFKAIDQVQPIPTEPGKAPTDIVLSSTSVQENTPQGTYVATISATDPDAGETFTYSLINSASNRFQIVGDQLLRGPTAINYETNKSFSIRIRVTDSTGLTFEKDFVIDVLDVNEAPTNITLSRAIIDEYSNEGTVIGKLTATDPDAGDTFTYRLLDTMGDRFMIVDDELRAGPTMILYSEGGSYRITVEVTDAELLTYLKEFTISVNATPTNIVLSNNAIVEGSTSRIGVFSTVDPNSSKTFTYTLLDDADGRFRLSGSGLYAVSTTSLDYRVAQSHQITVRSTDNGGLFFDKTFTILVRWSNRAPENIALSASSLVENSIENTLVGYLSATDPDGHDVTFLFTTSGRSASGRFKIVDNKLLAGPIPTDYTRAKSHNIVVTARDSLGASTDKTFTINVTSVNKPPTDIRLSASTMPERSAQGTLVGTFTTTDPDPGDTFTYTLMDDAGGRFQINGNRLEAGPTVSERYESETRDVVVTVTDSGGLSFTKVLKITITGANRYPTDVLLSNYTLPENSPPNTLVGILTAVDPDVGDTHTFTLVTGASGYANYFKVVGNELRTNTASFDYETTKSFRINIRATDAAGRSFAKDITIIITDVNEKPTDIKLTGNSFAAASPQGTVIGTLSATDPDAGDTHTFSLVDTSETRVQINGNTLEVGSTPTLWDAYQKFSVMVRATDAGGLALEKLLTVTNLNDPPVWKTSGTVLSVFADPGVYTSRVYAYDPDGIASYEIIGGTLPAQATLNPETGELRYTVSAPEPTFSTEQGSLGTFYEKTPVSLAVTATPNHGTSIKYWVHRGKLPWGLTLDSATGAITGTTTHQDEDYFVRKTPAPEWITPEGTIASQASGGSIDVTVIADPVSGTTTRYFIVSGRLPWGLKMGFDGRIGGTISDNKGTYTFDVTALASDGSYSDRTFSITVV